MNRASARWHLAASLICYLVCSPLLTYYISPYAIGGVLLVYPLYTITWVWGRRSGYTVAAAETGEEAVEICRAGGAGLDVLLTDVVLAGMRGGEVADRVRRISPGVRVIYMSGYAGKADTMRLETSQILMKPFSSAELLRRVAEAGRESGL